MTSRTIQLGREFAAILAGAGMMALAMGLFLASTEYAEAFDKPYVSAYGSGALVPDLDLSGFGGSIDESDFGARAGAAVGVYFFPFLRGEIEASLGYNSIELGSVDVSVWTPALMVNAIAEWDNKSAFTPYGGAGLGVMLIDLGPIADTVFAWQMISGVRWDLTKQMGVAAEYRYLSTADADFGPVKLDNLNSHIFAVGMKYNF